MRLRAGDKQVKREATKCLGRDLGKEGNISQEGAYDGGEDGGDETFSKVRLATRTEGN